MPTNETERRARVGTLERREADEGASTVAGYAAVFNEQTDIGGYFYEVIAPGAFSDSLATADVRAYFGHDSGRVLGRLSAGTLRLREDDRGLAVEIDLPETSDGRDARELISRGDISGMSFGFMVRKQEWDETGDRPVRTILAVDLIEVSIVSEPAYDGTSIALRSLSEIRKERGHHNFHAARQRVERKARMEAKFRGIV